MTEECLCSDQAEPNGGSSPVEITNKDISSLGTNLQTSFHSEQTEAFFCFDEVKKNLPQRIHECSTKFTVHLLLNEADDQNVPTDFGVEEHVKCAQEPFLLILMPK